MAAAFFLRRQNWLEVLKLKVLKKSRRISSEAQLLSSGLMADFESCPKASPAGHAGGPKIRWSRGTQACPEGRDQSNLTPDHGAGGGDLPTRDATLVIPGGAEELLQVIVGSRQTRNPVRCEEVGSIALADLPEVQERSSQRAGAARFQVYPLQHPVKLAFHRLGSILPGIPQDLRRVQDEAVSRLDPRPVQLVVLEGPLEVTVQPDEIAVYLLMPPFCVSMPCSSEASICPMRSLSLRPLATSGGRPSSVSALRTARQYAVKTLACRS